MTEEEIHNSMDKLRVGDYLDIEINKINGKLLHEIKKAQDTHNMFFNMWITQRNGLRIERVR